jgi:hypothetical protein
MTILLEYSPADSAMTESGDFLVWSLASGGTYAHSTLTNAATPVNRGCGHGF